MLCQRSQPNLRSTSKVFIHFFSRDTWCPMKLLPIAISRSAVKYLSHASDSIWEPSNIFTKVGSRAIKNTEITNEHSNRSIWLILSQFYKNAKSTYPCQYHIYLYWLRTYGKGCMMSSTGLQIDSVIIWILSWLHNHSQGKCWLKSQFSYLGQTISRQLQRKRAASFTLENRF